MGHSVGVAAFGEFLKESREGLFSLVKCCSNALEIRNYNLLFCLISASHYVSFQYRVTHHVDQTSPSVDIKAKVPFWPGQ